MQEHADIRLHDCSAYACPIACTRVRVCACHPLSLSSLLHVHRAVGWHLLAAKERAEMEAAQWKVHSEQLEGQATALEAKHASAISGLEEQIREVQVT